MKKAVLWIIVLLIIAGGAWYYYNMQNQENNMQNQETDNNTEQEVVENNDVQIVEDTENLTGDASEEVDPEIMERLEKQSNVGVEDEITDEDIRMIEEILKEITDTVNQTGSN